MLPSLISEFHASARRVTFNADGTDWSFQGNYEKKFHFIIKNEKHTNASQKHSNQYAVLDAFRYLSG